MGNTELENYLEQQNNPAAPAGLQQAAGSAAQGTRNRDAGQRPGTQLGAWLSGNEGPGSYTEQAQSWFTGANTEGTNNGFDSQFVADFNDQWQTALESGTARSYYEQPDATGVVFWDHKSTDGRKDFKFGDVYDHGEFKGNLYDQFDRDTANLMVTPWILDNDAQARAFSASDRMDHLDREIQAQREDRNANFEDQLKAMEFGGDVDKREKAFREGFVDEGLVAGGAAGGAAVGGGVGAAVGAGFFGVGALPGAAVGAGLGALAGGVGAFLNRDSLTEQAARAYEITKMSYDDMGLAAGISTGVTQWSGVGGKLISPLSNLTQGTYDVAAGKGGDGQSEFYRTDKQGQNQTPAWVKTLDVGATVGDSLLQFASPIGVTMYTTQMSGVVGGEVAELGFTGGRSFDYRTGGFDNIFTDDSGNFDASAAAAGIGKIGIDAVQLGMARGLVGRTNAALGDVGEQAVYKTLAARAGEKLPTWMGGSKGLAAGEERVRAAGFSFTRGADGSIVEGSRRMTLGLLAPSEQIVALEARVMGRRAAAARGGAATADDFYRAAHHLAAGERRIQSALVNAFGEGYEEVVQAILEPHSHGASATAAEMWNGFIYGAASGAGMSLGTASRAPSAQDRIDAMAKVGYTLSTGGDLLTDEALASMTDIEKRRFAAFSGLARETAEAAYRKISEDQAIEMSAGIAGRDKLVDAIESQRSAGLARATDRTDGSFVITQLEEAPRVDAAGNLEHGSVPVDAASASVLQTMANMNNHLRGLAIQHTTLGERLAELQANLDPADATASEQVAALAHQLEVADLTLSWGQKITSVLDQYVERMTSPEATAESIEADAAEMNDLIRRAFNSQLADYQGVELTPADKSALARATSLVFVRDPQDQAGSFQVLVPQVSARLTAAGANNVLEISHAILPAIRGDYDGDKIRQQAQLILDDTEFASARSGAHFIGAGASVNVGAPKWEKYDVEHMSEGLASDNVTLSGFAELTLQNIAAAVRGRYADAIEAPVLDEVLESFFTAVRANDKDARMKLIDGLATHAGGAMTEFSRSNLSNEWLWLDQLIVSSFQRFQESYAAHRPDIGEGPNTTVASKNAQSPDVRTRAAEKSATPGQTLANFAVGDSLFRKFQKLHYTAIGSPVLSAENLEKTSLTEQAMLYRELGQQVTQTELERVRASDDITGRVYVQLQALAADAAKLNPGLNRNLALVVMANLRVDDLEISEANEVSSTGHSISLAQMLLKQSLMADRREKQAIFDASPELQAKHAKLMKMTRPQSRDYAHGAEQAFVEVVGAQQMFTLLGESAAIFGPHQSVEQFIRHYVSLSELDRRDMTQALHNDPAYLGRKQSKNMPYDLDEMDEISPFRAVVDAVLSVGGHRIAIDKAGNLSGEIPERSDRTSENFRAAHAQVRVALQEFAGLSPRADGELTTEMVQRLLEGNPDFARQVMNLVPDVAANAAFEARGGRVYAANWLYTLFTIDDAKLAEMHYWRNLLLTEWNALGATVTEEGEERESAREYGRLPRRMHRTMYRLAAQPDGGLLLAKFVKTLESATDLTEFIRWANTTPGIRGEQAPFTAWVDDVAEFDKDKAQGGWTTSLQGAELREAITQLRTRSENLVDSLVAERTAWNADVRTMAAIRRVIKKDSGDKQVTLDAGDRELYNAFAKSLDLAGERMISLGPQAMIRQTLGALRGFYSSAHTKGKSADNVEAAGALDAVRDAFGYVTNYERMLASLTATNLSDVGSNLAQVLKDGGRSMDDFGRPVEWEIPSPSQMLDLLENPDTRPFARALLFPQVMERDMNDRLTPRFLVGKSLSDLLGGNSFKDLFPRNGRLSQEAAFKYVSMVEGVARKYDGHFSVQRVVNDIVIARTSYADHVLSEYELESMVTRAYHEVAQVLQAVGSIASVPTSPGTDALGDLMAEVRSTQRRLWTAQALGLDVTEEITDLVIDSFISDRETELAETLKDLAAQVKGDPANESVYLAQSEAASADFDRFVARVELLRTDDIAGQVVSMFAIDGDPTEQAAKKQSIVEYVLAHMSMVERASASKLTLNKLTQQLLDTGRNGQVDLSDAEWGELSRAVIGAYLDDVASTTAAGVSVSPWPDADRVQDQKYFDTSFAYLVEEMLRPDGPLAQAARDVHRTAGRQASTPITQAEFYDLLGRTILDGKRLGPWTSDIPRASMEANSRLDSSAAGAAISIPGNTPKRMSALIAATRRTTLLPDASLLSTVTLTNTDLNRDRFDEVTVTLPAGPASRPLAQLNNRFARSVVMTVAGQQVDLLAASRDLGRPWVGSETVQNSGYYEIHLDRVKRAVEIETRRLGLQPGDATVDIEFFHPDSQPESPEWFNNVYFEGTSFKLDADRHESLIATLWFANESISPAAQAAALDSAKLGLAALQVIETVPAAERAALEAAWSVDLAAALRSKTSRVLATDLGFGALDPEFYNAVYKDMKLRHFVRGTTTGGDVTLWSAEQVIAFQMANPGTPLPIEGAELWIPTDDVLRSMLGEQGTQGVAQVFDDQLEIDPSRVAPYRGVTDKMLAQFSEGVTGERVALSDTRVANRARQTQLSVRTMLDEKLRNAFDEKMRHFADRDLEINNDRGEAQRTDGIGFNAEKNLNAARKAGEKMLTAENLALHWANAGIPFGPRKTESTILSKALLRDLNASMEADGFRTGWIYREGSKAQPQAGLISEVSLGSASRAAYRVASRDLVVVELDSFAGDSALAKSRIDYLADAGAIVLLGATDGQADLRAELSEYLVSDKGYASIAGSTHTYQPAEFGSRFQNQRARASTLMETRGISTKSRVAVFSSTDVRIQENAAWADHTSERLGAIAVVGNLVPTGALAGFNVPVEQLTNASQIERVRAHIRGFDNAVGRAFLKDQANGHLKGTERDTADAEFDRFFDRLLQRFDTHPGVVLPQEGDEFGKGDIIPLVDSTGRVLLYRHGYKALSRDQVDERTARTLPDSHDAVNIAVFPTKLESAATVHTGTVVRFIPRAGYGLQVELNVPLSVFGDKKQLEWNGMKYVLAPKPDSVVLPEHGFFENWGIDLIGSAVDMTSKESFDSVVDNHRNAFAFFGIDFLPDVTEFFFPGQRDDANSRAKTREMLHAIATKADRISVAAAHELMNSERLGAAFTELLPSTLVESAGGVGPGWLNALSDLSPIENRIAAGVIVYLMTHGQPRVEDVLSSGGFNADGSTSSDMQSRLMPRLFTQIFDNAPLGSALRTEINRRLNEQLYNPNADGTGYVLHQDFTFEVRNTDSGKNMRGFLQFPEAHSSGDNPVKNGMSFDETERSAVSQHSAAIAHGSIGAETAYAHDIAKARLFASGKGVTRFERDALDGGAWRMLTAIPDSDKSFKNWRAQTPAEAARRDNAREAMVQFRQEIVKSDENGWTEKQRKDYLDLSHSITRELGLLDSQATLVDFWVRQLHGRPHGQDLEGHELGRISGKAAIEGATDILRNVQDRYLPVLGGEVPQTHLHDLQAIFRANKNRSMPWRPRDSMGTDAVAVKSWDDWVKVSLGSALTSDNLFDPLYLLALDGFVHGYQNATRSLMDLPVSVDALVAQNLLDPELNHMVVSISDQANLLATDPFVLDAAHAVVDELIGGRRISGKFRGKAAPASEVAKRRDSRRKWRKEHDIPVPVDVSLKNFRKNGADFINTGTTTNALVRGLINLRVGTALINPALYVSMGPEQWIRGSLDRAANVITGQATVGTTAHLQARATEKLKGTAAGAVAETLGFTSRYTPEELADLGRLYKDLGRRHDFRGMLYRDLMFRRPHADSMGKVERVLEGYAKFGSKMQDPTYGMKADTMARRYLEGALQHIMATPTVNVVSVSTLAAQLKLDPTYLQKNFPEAHQAGTNALAQIRSLKETTASQILKGIYEPLSASSNSGVNTFANIVLKLPLLFSGYAMNVATTILGLQGLDQMTAMFFDGRDKPTTLIGRMSAKVRGHEFTDEENQQFDLSSVMEGIDLSRAFIRGGLTHTGLFAFGMMAGGLGLSGEDDEMKKRRRLSAAQGVGFQYDPRRIENDFRNADALFLDVLPFGLGSLFAPEDPDDARAAGQLHWMLRQFVSPIVGMEKFFETGDFRHVRWGFEDALGSFPLINTMMWHDVLETTNQLADQADALASTGKDVDAIESAGLLTQIVGTYERMLFESSFVNQLYIGHDPYDRDPYVLPLRDSNGELQRDIEGNVRPNNLALQSYLSSESGQIEQGYMGRRDASIDRHVLTENRATLAFVSSIFTGGWGESDYVRYNMPVKLRKIDKPEITQEEAEAYVLAAFQGAGGMPSVTTDEILPQVRNQLYALGDKTGKFYTEPEVRAVAEKFAKSRGWALLSTTNEAGREVLNDDGARAIFDGLLHGTVQFGDPSLGGVYITPDVREKITADWSKELVQEGVNLGLDETKAISRMKRIMYGPLDNPEVPGLSELLWSDKIDYHETAVYKQLNTTYVMGPDGRPWATGYKRDDMLSALGLHPVKGMITPEHDGTDVDSRMNTIDLLHGNNTGLRALEPLDTTEYVPTAVEIGKRIEKAIEDAAKASYTPFTPYADKESAGGGSGWVNFGGYGGYGGGYGGGGGGGGAYFTKMYSMPDNVTPYGNSSPFINTSNPIIRRAFIRRERVWSERGRLKQWQ